jgi:ATP-dependent RNA circularization protein (DNA/RNA ligase family)
MKHRFVLFKILVPHLFIFTVLEMAKQDQQSRLEELFQLLLINMVKLITPLQESECILELTPLVVPANQEFKAMLIYFGKLFAHFF